MTTDTATFGIIGTGGIAQSQHLPNISRAPHIKLKTACDMRADVLAAMQAKYDIPHTTTDHCEVLADPDIEAVIVATREDVQARLTMEALNAGKHVYVEKPLAETPEQCAAVVETQKATGKHVAVGFNRRFAPAYRQARRLVDADGGPHNITCRISDDYVFGWGKGREPGFRVIHEVCHIFDICRWLADSDVKRLYCAMSRDDEEVFVLTFASGCVATIVSSGYATCDLPKERIEIISDHGGVTVEEFVELRTYGYPDADAVYLYPGHSHPDREYMPRPLFGHTGAAGLYAMRRSIWELTRSDRDRGSSAEAAAMAAYYDKHHADAIPMINYMVDKGWIASIDEFARSILAGQTPINATAYDGLAAADLAQAAIKSRQTGQPVEL